MVFCMIKCLLDTVPKRVKPLVLSGPLSEILSCRHRGCFGTWVIYQLSAGIEQAELNQYILGAQDSPHQSEHKNYQLCESRNKPRP